MPRLQLTLLGGFYARVAGGPAIDIATRKTRALLAYLALPLGRQHTREALASLLWSDRGEKQAQASLRQALVELNRAKPVLFVHRSPIHGKASYERPERAQRNLPGPAG